jgi:alcohol dehydrogenase, propanol-preferring
MKAMLFFKQGDPLKFVEIPNLSPSTGEILVRVEACGVCRTDLHILEGEVPCSLPRILGHQIVGIVEETKGLKYTKGDRVGIPWLGFTCGVCTYCTSGKENLCDQAKFTGCDIDGGFASHTVCREEYAIKLPLEPKAEALAPLLCAGLIGFRAYQKVRKAKSIGFYGFGSSAHLLLQIANQEDKKVYVFTKENDEGGQTLAKKLGAFWVGSSNAPPSEKIEAAIIFAPAGELIPQALKALSKGGSCICAGIHMSDIPSFPYKDLFFEKTLTSISHLTKDDGRALFDFLENHPIETIFTTYPLEKVNEALSDLKAGRVKGSLVLKMQEQPS